MKFMISPAKFKRMMIIAQVALIPLSITLAGGLISAAVESRKSKAENLRAAAEYVEPLFEAIQNLRDTRHSLYIWAQGRQLTSSTKEQKEQIDAALRKGGRFNYEVLRSCSISKCEAIENFIAARQKAWNRVCALSGFGSVAIPFLVAILEDEDVEIRQVATVGLEIVASSKEGREDVQNKLLEIINNKTHLYSWYTVQSAIKISGWIGFEKSRDDILKLQAALGPEYWERAFDRNEPHTKEREESLRLAITKTINHLDSARK